MAVERGGTKAVIRLTPRGGPLQETRDHWMGRGNLPAKLSSVIFRSVFRNEGIPGRVHFSDNASSRVAGVYYEPIKRLLKRLALPPWEQISEPEKISLLLGGSLPPHWKTSKTQREQWRNRCSNHSALLALKLSSLLTSLPTTVQSA